MQPRNASSSSLTFIFLSLILTLPVVAVHCRTSAKCPAVLASIYRYSVFCNVLLNTSIGVQLTLSALKSGMKWISTLMACHLWVAIPLVTILCMSLCDRFRRGPLDRGGAQPMLGWHATCIYVRYCLISGRHDVVSKTSLTATKYLQIRIQTNWGKVRGFGCELRICNNTNHITEKLIII